MTHAVEGIDEVGQVLVEFAEQQQFKIKIGTGRKIGLFCGRGWITKGWETWAIRLSFSGARARGVSNTRVYRH